LSKVADFDPPHLHLAPPQGVTPVEFRGNLWHQKSRIPVLSCVVVCVILRLAVVVELRLVTDTDRPTASTAVNKKLSYHRVTARCVLSVVILPITAQQCRNYLYDKSWPNRCHEVGGLVGGNVCVINKPTTVELCISPVYRRLAVAKFSKSTT